MRNKKAKALRKHVKTLVKDKSKETTYIGGEPPMFKQVSLLSWKKVALGIPVRVSQDCLRFYTQSLKKHVKKFGVIEGE